MLEMSRGIEQRGDDQTEGVYLRMRNWNYSQIIDHSLPVAWFGLSCNLICLVPELDIRSAILQIQRQSLLSLSRSAVPPLELP